MTFMLLVGCTSGLLMLYVCGTLAFITTNKKTSATIAPTSDLSENKNPALVFTPRLGGQLPPPPANFFLKTMTCGLLNRSSFFNLTIVLYG